MSMTENEAIRQIKEHITIAGCEDLMCDIKALEMAIQALEKQSMVNEILHELREYSAIGTIEEFKSLKDKSAAKKPIRKPNHNWTDEEVICPTCGSYILGNNHHCKCGQALEN